MNNYQQHLREIAEEMAKALHPSPWTVVRESLTEYYLIPARIAVKHMAKSYRDGYLSNYDGKEGSDEYKLWNENCITEMIDLGLIAPPENNEQK